MTRLPLNWVLALVALHSVALGVAMLAWPLEILEAFGWEFTETRFYPAQSGLFLIILGIVYAMAIRRRAYVPIVVFSKLLAVAFLVSEAWRGSCPPIVFLIAAVDGFMGALVAVAWWRERSGRGELGRGPAQG